MSEEILECSYHCWSEPKVHSHMARLRWVSSTTSTSRLDRKLPVSWGSTYLCTYVIIYVAILYIYIYIHNYYILLYMYIIIHLYNDIHTYVYIYMYIYKYIYPNITITLVLSNMASWDIPYWRFSSPGKYHQTTWEIFQPWGEADPSEWWFLSRITFI